ncbi:MAG: hypothetical protein KF778_02590 [Rhodocyclaceae bacterium]|nr:hypothetical protein [Rhodocyclaceae bacterium]MBX3667264.1 hypothetical protein [Rhodocyclaceae bacterium]
MSETKQFVVASPHFFAGLTSDYLDLINEILCGEPDAAAAGELSADMELPFRWTHSSLGPYGGC